MASSLTDQPLRVNLTDTRFLRLLGAAFFVFPLFLAFWGLMHPGTDPSDDNRIVILMLPAMALGIGLPMLSFRRCCDIDRRGKRW